MYSLFNLMKKLCNKCQKLTMERFANILYIPAMANESSYGFVWETKCNALPLIMGATKRVRKKGWFSPRFINDCWVFDYSISAYGKYRVGRGARKWRERPARVGHLYPPHVTYAEDLRQAGRPIEDAWLIFGGGEAAGLDRLVPKGYSYARFLDPEGLCLPLLEKAASIGQGEGDAGFWKAQAVLCEIIWLLISAKPVKDETYAVGSRNISANSSAWLASVREYLRGRCNRPIRLGDLAKRFNVSVSTLCHRYHGETGQSPVNDHLRMRMELVKTMLLKGQRLKEIAEETGFYDQYHLSKMFKQLAGISPRQFVRSLAETR